MSDFIPSPYEFDSPEGRAERNAMLRGAGIAATSVLPSWMTQVTPYRVDPEGQGHWQAPGGALAFYGGAGEMIPMAYNFGMGKLGLSNRIPPFPGAEEALRQYAETKDMAFRTIPHMEPQTPDEQTVQDLAFGTAGMAVPGAGYVTGPLGKVLGAGSSLVPYAGRLATPVVRALPHMAIPGMTTGNAVGGAVMTSGAVVLAEKEKEDAIRAMGGDPAQLRLSMDPTAQAQTPAPQQPPATGTDQWDLSAPDQSHQVVNPQSGAAAQVPFPTSSTTNPYTISLKDLQAVPQYGSTGEAATSWGEFLAEMGAVGAATWIGLKHGGAVLDPAYKFVTGKWGQYETAGNIAAHNANLADIDAGRVTAAAGAPQTGGAARGEAPLPGKAGTIGTQISQAMWDKTRLQSELLKAIGDKTPAGKLVTEQLNAELGNTNGSSALHIRIGEQMATGVNDATGHQLPSVKEMVQRYDQLPQDKQAVFDTGAHSAAELDLRDALIARRNAPGQGQLFAPYADEAIRTNFTNTHTDVLRANKAAMLADPETKAVHDYMMQIMPNNLDEAVYQGRVTPEAAARFKAERPNYVPPTDPDGHITGDLFTPHAKTTAFETPNAPVVDSVVNHYLKFYGELAHNTVNDNVMRQLETYTAANPNKARLITKTTPGSTEGRALTVYREGVPHTWQIEHTGLHNSFKSNIAQTNVWMNGLDAFRNSMQSGTTGVSATVLGQRPFAVIQALRSVPQIAMDRTPGTSFGMIDRGLQRATGGRFGSRLGVDPTQYASTAYHAVAGSAAVTARNMVDILRNPANPISKGFRILKGDPWTGAAAQWLEHKYETSNIAQMRRTGATGGGTGGVYDVRSFNRDPRSTTGFNPLADTVPGVFHPDGLHIPFTKVALPGTRGAVSTYINLRTLLRDIHSAIADSANASYFAQNPHLSDAVRTFETRRVIGDPSASGASRIARGLGQATPYLNPSIQDVVRAARNFRDHPGAFVAGTVGTLVLANAASLLTAMLGGQKHLDVLEKHMTSHERASNIPFFHDMQNEQNYTEINLAQRLRMFNPPIQELLALGTGAYKVHQGEPEYDRIVHSLADMFSHHVSMGTASGMVSGAGDFFDIVQAPQAAQVLAGLVGQNINPIATTVGQNLLEGKRPISSGVFTDIGSPTRVPGRQQNAYISKDDNGWVQRLFSNIMGIAGHGLHDAMSKGWANYQASPDALHGVANALDGMVGTAGQSWRDNAPFGNSVWSNNIKMNYRNPMEENFSATMDKMRTMPKATDITAQGFTRPGGLPIAQGETPTINPDPRIQQMLAVVNDYHADITTRDMPQINDLQAQLRDIDNNTIYDPAMVRQIHNAQVGKINAAIEVADEKIREMNAWLSHIAGKTVHVRSFDPSKGMEQFHD